MGVVYYRGNLFPEIARLTVDEFAAALSKEEGTKRKKRRGFLNERGGKY